MVTKRFVECVLDILHFNVTKTWKILQLVCGCSRYISKTLINWKAVRDDRYTELVTIRTPNDVRRVSTSVLLTLLIVVSVVRNTGL